MALPMPTAEAHASALRPVATWVRMPDETGRLRLTQIWTVPNPIATSAVPAMRRTL